MKIFTFVLISTISFSTQLFSQDNKCNCLDNLTKLIVKTEENYAGFPTKVNATSSTDYQRVIKKLQRRATIEQSPKICFYLLKEYVRFFKDKHFVLSYTNEEDYDAEKIKYSDSYFKNTISKKKLSEIEGVWINADTSLKIAIQKTAKNTYKGIVLEARDAKISKDLVYFTLTTTSNGFIAKEYNSFITTDIPAKQKGNLLQIWNHSMFGKIYPNKLSPSEQEELRTWRNNNNGLNSKKLSSKTAYLKIPTFFNNDDKIQQLVSKSDSTIKTCDNLIIDLTGNGGGNTGWVSFLPYLMTNPVLQFDTYLRVTPENVKFKLADLEPFVLNPIPDEYKKYFPDQILTAYKKAFQELPTTKNSFYPIPGVTFPFDTLFAKPKKIALLVDDFCGSSTEYFISISKQSKKTVTYGINTIGMMDYEGMSNPTALPYDKYILMIPIVKSSWTDTKPIDQKGFKPDKLLTDIKQIDWIEYVKKDLEKE